MSDTGKTLGIAGCRPTWVTLRSVGATESTLRSVGATESTLRSVDDVVSIPLIPLARYLVNLGILGGHPGSCRPPPQK